QTRKRGVTVGCGGCRDSDDGGGGFGYFSRGEDGGVRLEMMTMVCHVDGSGGGAWRGGDGVRGCDGGVHRCGGWNPAGSGGVASEYERRWEECICVC
ncbi:hypothetical protein Tco_1342869, partial [Tanacetum coccineum]